MNKNSLADIRHSILGALSRDERAVSAVEFALVAPLMIGIYLGVSEIAQGIGVSRKVTLTARALGDLTSQATGIISNAEMSNIFDAAAAVMAPYPVEPLKVTVTALNTGTNRKTVVAWSESRGGQPKEAGKVVGLRIDMVVPNTQMIMAEVSYDYTPTIGYTITGPVTIKERIIMATRVNNIARVP